ncbi:MAG: sugar ABC transporter substrate-binding protein [Oscillospiraceae bacterium]|nr:sugar ABC transporter substrate-binding protein [Oscillospiraceae bacterium]
MKKSLALVLCIALLACCLAACKAEPKQPAAANPQPSTSNDDQTTPATEEPDATPDETTPDDTTPDDTTPAEAPKIMFIAKNLADPYSTWLMSMCEKYMNENWPEAEYVVFDQQADPANTESLYDQAVLEGYDLVVLQKVSGSQDTDALLQDFASQGVRSVVINNEVSDGVSLNVIYPEYEMGSMVAAYAAENLPENAKVCILKSTPSLFSSEERAQAYIDMIEKDRPDVEILDTQNCEGWSKDIAINVMSDWCQRFDQIDAVLSANDGMVLGAIEAAKADGRDVQAMQFYGIDGLADGCLSIEAGEETGSVLQDAGEMAKTAVELAQQLYNDPEMDAVKIELEPVLITAENISDFIEMHRSTGVIK